MRRGRSVSGSIVKTLEKNCLNIELFLDLNQLMNHHLSLTQAFKASLHQSKLPSDWKTAHIVPAHKNGNRSLPNNYWPISLTSLCFKALEHIIPSNIYAHLSQTKILFDAQYDFRDRRSSKSQLIVTINDFMKCLNSKGLVHAILDFEKAFDKVPHKKLCDKLATYEIQGKTLEWISDFICNMTQMYWLGVKSATIYCLVSPRAPL